MVLDATTSALERELEMVRSAVEMVAGGHAPSVTVGGLRFGDELVAAAARLAGRRPVRIVPLWNADERGTDVRVERVDHD